MRPSDKRRVLAESEEQSEIPTLPYAPSGEAGSGPEHSARKWPRVLLRLHVTCNLIALVLVGAGFLVIDRTIVMPGITRGPSTLLGATVLLVGDILAGVLFVLGLVLLFVPEPGRDRGMLAVIMNSTAVSFLLFLRGSVSVGSP